jgi:hypothetical protein
MATSKKKTEIKVGQWVFLPLGSKPMEAQVLEDRGNFGVDGEHVFLVHVPMEEGVEARQFEVAESQLLRPA